MDLIYNKTLPTADEYNKLRENVGWGIMPNDIVEKSFDNTLFGVSVYDNNKIIGTGRIVGDGGLCFYIQDIMVLKDFQKKGIGSKIMDMIMNYLKTNASVNSYIGLMSAKGLENFYSKYEFMKRPNENFGSGMTQKWKGSI